MDEKLLILLGTKSFFQLSDEETKFVLQNITEKEYTAQHSVLCISSEIIDEDLAEISIDTKMYNKLINTNNVTSILEYKVSLIKVAAIFLVAFVSYHLVIAHIYSPEEQVPLYVHSTDTVFKIEKVYNTDTVFLTEYKTRIVKQNCDKVAPKIAQSTLESQISKEEFEFYKKKIAYDLQQNKRRRKGKSLSRQTNIFNDTISPIEDNTFIGIE